MDDGTLIAGVGDEVLLFIALLLISFILVYLMSRRRNSTTGTVLDTTPARSEDIDTNPHYRDGSSLVPNSTFQLRLVSLQSSQTITTSSETTLLQLQRQYFQREISSGQSVQFIYHGRLLTNSELSLFEHGVQENTSLHVHVSSIQRTEGTHVQHQLDLSSVFVPIISVVFGICWVCVLLIPGIFTFQTKLMLFLLSTGFVFLVYRNIVI